MRRVLRLMAMASVVQMLACQQAWMDDTARKTIANKARQIGLTFATAAALDLDCLEHHADWYYLSSNEERAKEAIEYCARHAQAIGAVLSVGTESGFQGTPDSLAKVIRFPGTKSKIVGLPANPVTARGASGNAVLDEFAHHLHAEQIYKAVYPITTRGFCLRIISTPNGQQGPFWRLWTSSGKHDPSAWADIKDGWSRHQTDIHQAVAQGLVVDLDELRDGCLCEEDWQQEYCCAFLDEAHAWLPFELIESAYDPAATMDGSISGNAFLGVDVGRKRDLTVLWALEMVGDVAVTRAIKTMSRAPFSEQKDELWATMPNVHRCSIDQNGIGAQLAEEAEARWPGRAEGVSLNGQVPAKLAAMVRERFERRTIRIPDDDQVRRDLHAVRRTHTDAGNVRFEAPRTKDGHADRFWALALALNAASKGTSKMEYKGDRHATSERFTDFAGGDRSNWGGY